jgi:hypothetical protein
VVQVKGVSYGLSIAELDYGSWRVLKGRMWMVTPAILELILPTIVNRYISYSTEKTATLPRYL